MLTFRFCGADGAMIVTETLTSGMVGKQVKFEFSEEWDRLKKTAVYAAGGVVRVSLNVGEVDTIPAEVLAKPMHNLYVGIYGESDDGTLIIPTIRARGPGIKPGANPNADPSTDPALPVWTQILNMIGDLDELNTEAKENLVAAVNEVAKTGKLDASKLSEAIDTALAQAKESGEFDGKDGEPGAPGKDGYTPVKGVDYYTEEDKAGYSELIAAELARRGQLKPEFANSVEGCTDTSKLYVLPDNFLYAYMTRETSTEPTELYDPAAATLDERHSGTPGSVVSGAGYVMTDYIPVDMAASTPVLLKVTCNGFNATANEAPYFQKIAYYDSAKNCLGTKYLLASATKGSGAKLETSGNDTTIYVGYVEDGSQVTFYSQIAFVRIEVKGTNTSGATESDRNLITSIIAPNSGGITIETGWTNTGHAFVPADYEERIISLEHGVAKLQSGGSSEVTVPTFWEDAVDVCISKIKALQVGRNCVTFPFFSDNHQRLGFAGVLIRKVMDECRIPFCFYGGDSIGSGYIASEDVMIAQDKAFDTVMSYIPNGRFCRAVGNHDGYWNVSEATGDEYRYSRAQVYELFMREESVAQNKRYGEDGTYYYVDDIASKVRFIVLNTNDNDSDGGASVDSTQLEWMQNTALSFSESGWAVVFISHQPISNHYHANISNAEEVRTVVSNYISGSATNKADIIGWYSGHIHRDRIYTGVAVNTTDDSVGAEMPFTQVTITSDHTGIAYDAATKHTVANDDQSHAIDFVTINRNTRTVALTRLGIGEDRSYAY